MSAVHGLRSGPSAPHLLLTVLALVLAACGSGTASPAGAGTDDPAATDSGALPDGLRVGLVPNISPEQQRARYAPLGDHLEQELGTDVELVVAPDYAGVVTALAAGRLDVAYLGALTYAQAERQVDLTPLVTEVDRETGTPRYLSAVVVPAGSPHRSVEDVVADGGSFAFGDPSSTSGSLYPRLMLEAAGADCSPTTLDACPPLEEVRFTGGHDATALAVARGTSDAGGLELRILHRLEREDVVPEGALRVVGEREVMGYPWVARTALGQPALDAVADAFLAVDDPALLDLLRAASYVPVASSDYDEVRDAAERLGLLR